MKKVPGLLPGTFFIYFLFRLASACKRASTRFNPFQQRQPTAARMASPPARLSFFCCLLMAVLPLPQNVRRMSYHTTPPWVEADTPSFRKPNVS